jgi:hypothetical protein
LLLICHVVNPPKVKAVLRAYGAWIKASILLALTVCN